VKELQGYQADIAKFEAANTQVLGISMDSSPSNKRFAQDIGVKFPLLSDWNRTTSKEYGLYDEKSGYGRRATFVVDKDGRIQHVEAGRTAIDPSGAYQVCDLLMKKTKPPQ
jgi:peroxiredoxin Q/BCP